MKGHNICDVLLDLLRVFKISMWPVHFGRSPKTLYNTSIVHSNCLLCITEKVSTHSETVISITSDKN